MKQRELGFLHNISDDDRILLNMVLDRAEAAEERYVTRYTFFLDERERKLCEQALASVKYENYQLWGGRENAERTVLCVYPPYGEVDRDEFPIVPVTFSFRKEDKLSHRDILGSLMALGIKRECVGDILVNEGAAAVFVYDTAANDVLRVNRIGRVGVKASEGFDESFVSEISFKEITGTVASLRLDSIISVGLRISREKAAALIKGGLVEVDHVRIEQPRFTVQEGAVFSARGHGKYLFKSIGGRTGKDRIHITICKYI